MSDENLTALLAKRAPKPRAKSTTALIWILILLIGILLGGAIGKGAASTQTPAQQVPAGPPAGAPGGAVRGSVGEVGAGTVTIDTRDSGGLAPGDEVVILKAPEGASPPVSP